MDDIKKYFQIWKERVVPTTSMSSFKLELKTWYTVYEELFHAPRSKSSLPSDPHGSSGASAVTLRSLFSYMDKTEASEESEEESQMRTRPWYFDTPAYALPNLRKRELSLYPRDGALAQASPAADKEASKSLLDSPVYQSIAHYRRNVIESIVFLTGSLHALIDIWIKDVEQPIRNLLKRDK